MNAWKYFLSLLIVTSSVSFLAAAEKTSEKNTEPVIPKRELKFDVSEEEVAVPLSWAQDMPGLLDQRYVAIFQFDDPMIEVAQFKHRRGGIKLFKQESPFKTVQNDLNYRYTRIIRNIPTGSNSLFLQFNDLHHSLLSGDLWDVADEVRQRDAEDIRRPMSHGASSRGHRFRDNVFSFSGLVKRIPEQHRPPDEFIKTFTGSKPLLIRSTFSLDEKKKVNSILIKIFAPTPKQARQWMEGWLTLYDWGLCYPTKKALLQLQKDLKQRLQENREQLQTAENDLPKCKKTAEKLKEFEAIQGSAYVNLAERRRMLSVDLAGVKARIEACNRMLANVNYPQGTPRREQVESAKVTAEIELIGLEAKRREIDRIIEGAQKLHKMAKQIAGIRSKVNLLESEVSVQQDTLEFMEKYPAYEPLQIHEGKIKVRRIKWVSAEPKEEKSPGLSQEVETEGMRPAR